MKSPLAGSFQKKGEKKKNTDLNMWMSQKHTGGKIPQI